MALLLSSRANPSHQGLGLQQPPTATKLSRDFFSTSHRPCVAKSSPVGLTNLPPNSLLTKTSHPFNGFLAAVNPSGTMKVYEWGRLGWQQLRVPEPKQRTWIWCGIGIPWMLRVARGYAPSVGVVSVRNGPVAMVVLPDANSDHCSNMTDLVSRDSGGMCLFAKEAIQLPLMSKVMGIGSYAGIPWSTSLMADGSVMLVACSVSLAATNSVGCPRNPAAGGFGPGVGKLVFGLESIMGSGPKIGF